MVNAKVIFPDGPDPTWLVYEGIPMVLLCPCQAEGKPLRIDATVLLPGGSLVASAIVAPTWKYNCSKPQPKNCSP